MAWRDARAQLAKVIRELEPPTRPESLIKGKINFARVYEFPPESVPPNELPACIILLPAGENRRHPGNWAHRVYNVTLRLLVLDEDGQIAAEIVDELREAVVDALDGGIQLKDDDGNLLARIQRDVTWTEGQTIDFASVDMWSQDVECVIEVSSSTVISA